MKTYTIEEQDKIVTAVNEWEALKAVADWSKAHLAGGTEYETEKGLRNAIAHLQTLRATQTK